MIVSLKQYNTDVDTALRKSSYTKRIMSGCTDYIKKINDDARFHAKPTGKKSFDLHVDIYTDGNKHFAPHMPESVKEEEKFIKKRIAELKKQKKKKGGKVSLKMPMFLIKRLGLKKITRV